MNLKKIQKYKDKTVSELLNTAQQHFNLFIRLRDCDDNGFGICISSGRPLKVPSRNAHAGHLYPAGQYPLLRFNENNVHLQSLSDNYFRHANQVEYVKNLVKKIGSKGVQELEEIAEQNKRINHKWDRFTLIEIIEKYKAKSKQLKKMKNF